uniref:Cytochrome b-c1 complex subunit 8 n=1 Tax=Solanum tuberosum TaxID=4113 RepID=M1BUK7_SOLTU
MGKQPVKLKAVVYALSPFQQKIMPGLWKDLPGKIHHKVSENWISATLLLGPLVGTYSAEMDIGDLWIQGFWCNWKWSVAYYPSNLEAETLDSSVVKEWM